MTNYKKMYGIMKQASIDALAILSAKEQREDSKEWAEFALEQAIIRANYVYRTTVDLEELQ